MGRVHQGQGGDVLSYRHRRRTVDRDQVRLQETGAAQCVALSATIRVQREKAVQVAKNLLTMKLDFQDIAQVAELSVEEVKRIAEGDDIMENYI